MSKNAHLSMPLETFSTWLDGVTMVTWFQGAALIAAHSYI